MSKVVDNRVVSMEFDNSQFEKNVQTSMKTLDSLNKSLDSLPNTSGKGLASLSRSASRIDLSGIASGVDAINHKFSTLGIAGQEVIRSLTRTAMNFGKGLWNNTFGQIKTGGMARASKIAQAQFSMEGIGKSWKDFEEDIQYAVDGTAYGLDAAAGAAARFATAGVKAGDDMKKALRGISGTAAMSGTSYEEMADVFTQVASQHKVTGMTLDRLSARNIDALSILSKHLGKSSEEVRKMVSKGQVSFDTFSQAMDDAFGKHAKEADRTFSGVTANIKAALSKIGALFYQPLIDNDSNVVKMLETFKNRLNELKGLLAPTIKVITDNLLALADTGKKWIEGWDFTKIELGLLRIKSLLNKILPDARIAIGNLAKTIGSLKSKLEPLKKVFAEAFYDIFPKKSIGGFELTNLSKKFDKFVQSIKFSEENLDKFKRIFKGVFATFSLAGKVIQSAGKGIKSVFEKFDGGKFLEFLAKIGDFMVELNENYNIDKPFDTLLQIFEKLKDVCSSLFGSIPEWISNFKSLIFTTKESGETVQQTTSIFDTFKKVLDDIGKKFDYYKGKFLAFANPIIAKIKEIAAPIVAVLKPAIDNLIAKVKEIFSGNLFQAFVKLFSNSAMVTAVFAGNIGIIIKRFMDTKSSMKDVSDTAIQFAKDFGELVKSFKEIPKTLNKTLTTLTKSFDNFMKSQSFEAKTKGILNLAIAVGILAVSMFLLASIPQEKLWGILGVIDALSVTIVGFMEATNLISKVDDNVTTLKASFAKMADAFKQSSLASSMIKLAVAVLILAFAMKALQDLEWDDIGQGLVAITVFMGELFGMAVGLDKLNVDSFNKIAISFIILSAAIKILADCMVNMQGLNWDDVLQGLTAITVIMAEFFGMAVGLDKLNIESFNKISVSFILLASAIKILGDAMVAMKDLTWEDIAQGLIVVTVLLGEMLGLAILLKKFGITEFVKTAAGITAVATGIAAIAKSVQMLGQMEPENLMAGVAALAIVLLQLMLVMFVLSKSQGFEKGAFALVAVGVAIMMIAHAFKTLGEMNPENITQAFMALTITLAGLTAVCLIAQDSIMKAALGMVVIAIAMNLLTFAIKSLGKADLMQLIKGMVALAVALAIMVVAVRLVEGSIGGAFALLILSAAILVFAAAIAMLTLLPLGDLAATMLLVVVALVALGAAATFLASAIPGAFAMLLIAAALLVLAVAVGIIAAIPFDAAVKGLVALGIAIVGFAALSLILIEALPFMAALAGILVLVSVGILALGGGIALLGMGLQTMSTYGALGIVAFQMFCDTLSKNASTLYATSLTIGVLAGALLLLDGALILCSVSLVLMSAAMLLFATACVAFSIGMVMTVKIIKYAIKDFKSIFNKEEFKKTGDNAVTGLADGVKAGIGKVVEQIKNLGKKAVEGLKSFFGKGKDSETGKIGANATEGFIQGLKSKLSDVWAAAKTIGQGFLKKLKLYTKEKSPSKATKEIGAYLVEGLVIGIEDNLNSVWNAAEDIGSTVFDSMAEQLGKVSDVMSNNNGELTITPVMDMSNIQNGIGYINDAVSKDRTAAISSNISTSREYQDSLSAYNQAQFDKINGQINNLAEAILNQPTPEVNANVVLQGDADGVFKLVQQSNNRYSKMYGKSAFA